MSEPTFDEQIEAALNAMDESRRRRASSSPADKLAEFLAWMQAEDELGRLPKSHIAALGYAEAQRSRMSAERLLWEFAG